MARGFVAGGVSFGTFSAICIALCGWTPMWLVSRTELVDKFCWVGEGIWETQARWGNDIEQLGVKCHGRKSTYETYCNVSQPESSILSVLFPSSSLLLASLDLSFDERMCTITRLSKVMVVCGGVFMCLSLAAGIMAHFARRFRTQIICSAVATFLSLISLCCCSVVMFAMQTSPLFSQEHYHDLSQHFANKYDSVSCSYQLPSVGNLLRYGSLDGPMQCLFPGPSFAFCLASIVGSLFTMVLFALKWREALLIRQISLQHHGEEGWDALATMDLNNTYSPLFGESLYSPSASSAASISPSPLSGFTSSLLTPSAAVPSSFKYDRHYSLYGAFLRQFSHHATITRHVVNALPPLLNMAHAVILGWWIMNGLAYAVHVELREIKHHSSHDLGVASDPAVNLSASYLGSEFGSALRHHFPKLHPIEYNALEHIIEFSPITTLSVFFKAGSYSFGLVQLLSTFIWPVLKVLCWSWFWYTPADEVFRGRLFAWVDALGKLTLANLFLNCLLAIVNNFTREIILPWYLLPLVVLPFHSLQVNIQFAINPGFGTYGFVLSFVLTMLMGEVYVVVHRYAKKWEEDRRDQEEKTWNLTGHQGASSSGATLGESQSLLLARNVASEDDPVFRLQDTPYLMMAESHQQSARKAARKRTKRRVSFQQQDNAGRQVQLGDEGKDTRETETQSESEAETDEMLQRLSERSPPPPPVETQRRRQEQVMSAQAGDRIAFFDDALRGQIAFYESHREEALCNHVFSPFPGHFYRFTFCGKAVFTVMILLTLGIIITAQTVESFEFLRSGLVGDIIIPEEQRNVSMSILGLPKAVANAGLFGRIPVSMVAVLYVFVILMPLVHTLGLAAMWYVPMTPLGQRQVIWLMELVSAWSALDVFVIVLFLAYQDVEKFTMELVESAGLAELDKILAHTPVKAFVIEKQTLLPAYGYLVCAVVLEKVLEHLIQVQFVTMTSERSGVRKVAHRALELFESNPASLGYRQDQDEEEVEQGEEGGERGGNDGAGAGLLQAPLLEGVIGNIVEEEEEAPTHPSSRSANRRTRRRHWRMTDNVIRQHMDVLGPTQGYFSASGLPGWLYAGLPLFVWRWFLYCGMVEEDFTFSGTFVSYQSRRNSHDGFRLEPI